MRMPHRWPTRVATHALVLLTLAAFPNCRAQGPEDATCAGCHRAIVDSYEKTPMARGSGPASDGLLTGSFDHDRSGMHYSIEKSADGKALLRYTRKQDPALQGSKLLEYFIGSGKRGRTYLFQTDGYWFQSPIDFYTRGNTWEMAPGYSAARQLPLTLAVDEGCLFCHGSGVTPSQAGSTNHFGSRPFTQGGITCARCHGDATAHVASGGKAAVLNPAKLDPRRRDSICQQCHLEGEVSVRLQGKRATDFKPGDKLFDNVAYFVHAQEGSPAVRAVSQVEALAQSVCKQKSGAAMSCTSCHDPHRSISAVDRVAFYRERCLSCHTGVSFRQQHHAEQKDCTACHMPTRATTDIAHEEATDHRILKLPVSTDIDMDETSSRLVAVLESRHDTRELGLAYASFAKRGDLFSLGESVRLLKAADLAMPQDASVALALAEMYDAQGDGQSAAALIKRAYDVDPTYPSAAARFGDLAANAGDPAQAISLWKQALGYNRADVTLAQRLAEAECTSGDRDAAIATLQESLHFSPDAPSVQATLLRLQSSPKTGCVVR